MPARTRHKNASAFAMKSFMVRYSVITDNLTIDDFYVTEASNSANAIDEANIFLKETFKKSTVVEFHIYEHVESRFV